MFTSPLVFLESLSQHVLFVMILFSNLQWNKDALGLKCKHAQPGCCASAHTSMDQMWLAEIVVVFRVKCADVLLTLRININLYKGHVLLNWFKTKFSGKNVFSVRLPMSCMCLALLLLNRLYLRKTRSNPTRTTKLL